MPFNLFRKKKQPEQEAPAPTAHTQPQQEAPVEPTPPPQEATPEPAAPAPVAEPPQEPVAVAEEKPQETPAPVEEQPKEQPTQTVAEEKPAAPVEPASKTYLKAMPLKELSDIANVEEEVKNGNIIILRVTPLAGKSIEDVKTAVNQLFQFAESIGGDIARLGEERVVICPKNIRIWREKTPAPVASAKPLPTAA